MVCRIARFLGVLLLVVVLAPALRAGATGPRPLVVAVGAPKMWVTPLSLDWGPVGVGDEGPVQTVTIVNLDSAPLTGWAGGAPVPAGPFTATQNCAAGVPPGGSCQCLFTFRPSAEGLATAVSTTSTNAGSFTIALRGTGVGAALHATPLSLDFGSVVTGATTQPVTVTVRNTGMATLTGFAGGGVGAPFSATQDCASGVAPGESCGFYCRFAPEASGVFTATSQVSSNGGALAVDLLAAVALRSFS